MGRLLKRDGSGGGVRANMGKNPNCDDSGQGVNRLTGQPKMGRGQGGGQGKRQGRGNAKNK